MKRMSKSEYIDLLKSLPKDVLIGLILKTMFRLDKNEILSAQWDYLVNQAGAIRDESIKIGTNHPFHSPEYQKHLKLWAQADRIDRQADNIFSQMEAEWERNRP